MRRFGIGLLVALVVSLALVSVAAAQNPPYYPYGYAPVGYNYPYYSGGAYYAGYAAGYYTGYAVGYGQGYYAGASAYYPGYYSSYYPHPYYPAYYPYSGPYYYYGW